MATAGSIVVDLLMRTGAFETDTKRAEARMKSLRKSIDEFASNAATATAAAAGAVIALGVTMVAKGSEIIDSQAKLAQQLDTTYESIAVLERAGADAGISLGQISTAGRALNNNLSKAAQGSKAQADALAKLGLSAETLIRLPLDQKIATINQALIDNVGASERAAVGADLFGARNAAALKLLNAEGFALAAKQVEIFGLNLSTVDAAQVEAAGDAMDLFGVAANGASVQLTKELAPIMTGIGDLFLTWAENAGGFEKVAVRVVDNTVDVVGFLADAIAGVGRAFTIVYDLLLVGGNGIDQILGTIAAGLVEIVDLIPGIDLSETVSGLREYANTAATDFQAAWKDIQAQLETPLPSDNLDAWVEKWRKTSKEAATEAVAARNFLTSADAGAASAAPVVVDETVERTREAIEKQVEALRQQVETYDATAEATIRYRISQGDLAEQLSSLGAEGELFAQQLISLTQEYTALAEASKAAEESQRAVEQAQSDAQRVFEATRTPLEKFNAEIERLNALRDEFVNGKPLIDGETYARAVQQAQDALNSANEDVSTFAEQASRNTQDIIAENLRNGFENGVDGIIDSFAGMIDNLIAQALAAKLAETLFGGLGVGSGGGLIGTVASALFGGARAFGGDVHSGRAYRVNELEPEVFIPRTSGTVIPMSRMAAQSMGGGVNVKQTINVTGRVDARTASQLQIEAVRRQRSVTARLG